MRSLLTITLLLIKLYGFAQSDITDTIYVNYDQTVKLIFDAPIDMDKSDYGSSEYLSKPKTEENILYLKANMEGDEKGFIQEYDLGNGQFEYKYGQKTDLFVVTERGTYEFIVTYRPKLHQKLYTYTYKESVFYKGEEKRKSEESIPVTSTGVSNYQSASMKEKETLEKMYKANCESMLDDRNRSLGGTTFMNGLVTFFIAGVNVKDDMFYYELKIINSSGSSYDINLISFTIDNKKGDVKQSAVQVEPIPVKYCYNGDINTVEPHSALVKVFVFDKFSISKDKVVKVECWEVSKEGQRGDRIGIFPLSASVVNKPKEF